jgi:endonuclease/exonuclease/phosphatase family metal-dependent hydrolase
VTGGHHRIAAIVGVLALLGALVGLTLVVVRTVDVGGDAPAAPPSLVTPPGTPSATPSAKVEAERLATMAPAEIAAEGVEARPPVAPPGTKDLAEAAEGGGAARPYSFVVTTFNVLGSQHSAPGGAAERYADGGVRTRWAAGLIGSYGSDIVGFGELQPDQYAAMAALMSGPSGYTFYPGTSLGRAGVPTNVMWRSAVWEATWQGSVTIPFMDSSRPMPIVRLRHLETGRELYVMNVHNSPRDARGREAERDRAEAIEIATINELADDDVPIVVLGDFNEHAEIFCRMTAETSLVAASGGSNEGACRPPERMRVDWIFGSRGLRFEGFRIDTSPAVRRITDHAVLTTGVTVPVP